MLSKRTHYSTGRHSDWGRKLLKARIPQPMFHTSHFLIVKHDVDLCEEWSAAGSRRLYTSRCVSSNEDAQHPYSCPKFMFNPQWNTHIAASAIWKAPPPAILSEWQPGLKIISLVHGIIPSFHILSRVWSLVPETPSPWMSQRNLLVMKDPSGPMSSEVKQAYWPYIPLKESTLPSPRATEHKRLQMIMNSFFHLSNMSQPTLKPSMHMHLQTPWTFAPLLFWSQSLPPHG
jgi:hypothetical protein